MSETMGWVREFYTRSRERWGASGILPHHRERAASLERLCGPGPKRVLELGAGTGGTAAAIAERGHAVVAVELAVPPSLRAHFQALEEAAGGRLSFVEGDFYDVSLAGKFDVVGYWNGFGVGSDADQRRLLRRIASEWIAPGGCLLLDVFNPWSWARIAGQEKTVETELSGVWIERHDFDPVGCRFIDSWWPEGAEDQALSQNIRCYTPADFCLFLEGTGLTVERMEVAGELIPTSPAPGEWPAALGDAWDYLAKLIPGV